MRLARNEDLPTLLALQEQALGLPAEHRLGRADLQIAIRCSTALVVEREGTVVAWGAATAERRDWRILAVVVAPEHRREGLGSMLVEALIALAPSTTQFVVGKPLTLEGGWMLVKLGFAVVAGDLWREPQRARRHG